MEFGPCHDCGSRSPSDEFALALLLVVGAANVLLVLFAGFDWKEMAWDSELPSGKPAGGRASFLAVVSLAAIAYHLLGTLWDARYSFAEGLPELGPFGNISPPSFVAALITFFAIFVTVGFHQPRLRPWPASSPYASAAEAATRPLQLS